MEEIIGVTFLLTVCGSRSAKAHKMAGCTRNGAALNVEAVPFTGGLQQIVRRHHVKHVGLCKQHGRGIVTKSTHSQRSTSDR